MFVEEFEREMARIQTSTTQQDETASDRLVVVSREINNLSANMLTGVLSSTLLKLLSDREAEKARLEASLVKHEPNALGVEILPHPAVLRLFEQKVGKLRETLDNEAVRGEAAEILSRLIESVTIYPHEPNGPEAEVVARVADLVAFAINDNAAPKGGGSCSMVVVAGTGFEPVTFRL